MYLNLSPDQRKVIDAIEEGYNVFVTGPAGTGKSYLLQFLKKEYMHKRFHLTASTGIAAVNIGGSTLHSWAGIGLGTLPFEQILHKLRSVQSALLRRKIREAKMLAIDEISMISSETLDLINNLFKAIRENDTAFGGLQLILFGDFLQLPPIVETQLQNSEHFCFKSKSWQEANLQTFVLTEIFRQTDQNFIKLLNNLRFGSITKDNIEILRERYNATDENKAIKPTILSTHNYQVEEINTENLKMLPSKEYVHTAKFSGKATKFDFLRKNCMASEHLKLKIGAQVMMLKNTYKNEGIINGSLGIIIGFSPKRNYPIVEFSNGKIITISPEKWAVEKYNDKLKEMVEEAAMTQIPLILAWAITVHKSQGMTLDKIECNLANSFAEGQIYVALSRVKDLQGLFIKSFNVNRIKTNPDVVSFYRNFKN
jgi:ATP-dependent DNA helicase PIF1